MLIVSFSICRSSVARFKLLDPRTGLPLTRAVDSAAEAKSVFSDAPATEHTVAGKRSSESEQDGQYIIESWQPKDVIISDEGGRSPVIGKITKVSVPVCFVH